MFNHCCYIIRQLLTNPSWLTLMWWLPLVPDKNNADFKAISCIKLLIGITSGWYCYTWAEWTTQWIGNNFWQLGNSMTMVLWPQAWCLMLEAWCLMRRQLDDIRSKFLDNLTTADNRWQWWSWICILRGVSESFVPWEMFHRYSVLKDLGGIFWAPIIIWPDNICLFSYYYDHGIVILILIPGSLKS